MRRLLLLLVLAASTALALTPPASAGGPTSVIVTDPATGEATALYYTDADYEQLDTMLTDGERLSSEPSGLGSRSLNLTWLIHDALPWQTQQLYLDAEGGPVVVTYGSEAMGNADDVTWLRPTESNALLLLADGLFSGTPSAAVAPPAPTPDPVVTETVVTETAWWSLSGWRWLVPGALLGAGGVLLATRSRSREKEPRQVLVDVSP